MVFVTNQEKLSSSVMQQIMNALRESPDLRAVLGEAIRPEPVWWMNGDPWIDGAVRELEEKRINKEMANIRKKFKGMFCLVGSFFWIED